MITRIELENFKGIRERATLDVKPITLLFGANSAGKSTVIHALHYAYEVLANHNLDADRTTLGGESIDLGGFRNLVHGRELGRRIRMLFEFDADAASLPDYTEGISDTVPLAPERLSKKDLRRFGQLTMPGVDFEDHLVRAWVRLEIGWDQQRRGPRVFAYEVGTSDDPRHPALRVEAGTGKSQTASLLVHSTHPVFSSIAPAAQEEFADFAQEVVARSESVPPPKDEPDAPTNRLLTLFAQDSALPTWRRPLRLWWDDEGIHVVEPSLVHIRRVTSKLAVGVGELLLAQLERLLYVGPLRTVPPRNYRPPLTEDVARWADGLGAWDALHRRGAPFVARAGEWLQKLGAGYRLELRHVREVEGEMAGRLEMMVEDLIFTGGAVDYLDVPKRSSRKRISEKKRAADANPTAAIRAPLWTEALNSLSSSPERTEVVLVDEKSGVIVRPFDVGVGISQVLPIIVAALYRGARGAGSFVAIEQPELHIHPRLQVALADLFIEQASRGTMSDHCFLVETHSEHLLLRLLRRIREAAAIRDDGDGRGVGAARGAGVNRGRPGTGIRPGGPSPRPAGPGGRPGGPDSPDEDAQELPDATSISPDLVSVVYVQRTEDGAPQFIPLAIDESGEFKDVWPEGFFDERLAELY